MKKASFNSKGTVKLTKRNVPDVSHITSKHSGKAKLSNSGSIKLNSTVKQVEKAMKQTTKKERPTWKSASKPKTTSTATTSRPKASFSSTGSVKMPKRSIPNVSNIVKNIPNVSGLVKNHSGKAKLSNTGTPQLKNPYRRKRKASFNDSSKLNLPDRIVPNVSETIKNHSGKAKLSSTGTVNLPERQVPNVSNIVKGPRSKRKRQELKAQQIANATGMSFAEAMEAVKNKKKKKIVTSPKPKTPWINKGKQYNEDEASGIDLGNAIVNVPEVDTKGLEAALNDLSDQQQAIMVRQRIFIENMLLKNKDFTGLIDDKILDAVATALYSIGPEQMDELYRFLKDENIEEKYKLTDPDYYGYDPEFTELTSLLIATMEKLGLEIQ